MKVNKIQPIPALLVFVLFIILASISFSSFQGQPIGLTAPITEKLGTELFTYFVVSLEILGVLMVASLVGAIYLAKREGRQEKVEKAVDKKPRFNVQSNEKESNTNSEDEL